MLTNAMCTEEVMVTPQELELLLVVRRKFKGCECCVEKVVEFVEGIEKVNKKDGSK